jgi:hypothetical protein
VRALPSFPPDPPRTYPRTSLLAAVGARKSRGQKQFMGRRGRGGGLEDGCRGHSVHIEEKEEKELSCLF